MIYDSSAFNMSKYEMCYYVDMLAVYMSVNVECGKSNSSMLQSVQKSNGYAKYNWHMKIFLFYFLKKD